jgi:hypothetical protein
MTPSDRRIGLRLIGYGATVLVAAVGLIVVAAVLVGWRELGSRLGL